MDNYIILSNDKTYLKECLNIIISKLNNEYKLEINENKTYVANMKNGVNFLGYRFYIKNNKIIMRYSKSRLRNIKKGIKRSKYKYSRGMINFNQFFCSIETYLHNDKYVNNYQIKNTIERYW